MGAIKGTTQINVDDLIPIGLAQMFPITLEHIHASTVHQHIDSTFQRSHAIGHCLNSVFIHHIELGNSGTTTERPNFLGYAFQFSFSPSGKNELHSRLGIDQGTGLTNTAACTSDPSDFIFEVAHVFVSI